MDRKAFLSSGDAELLPLEESDAEFLRDGVNHRSVRTNIGVRRPQTTADEKEMISSYVGSEDVHLLISHDVDRAGIISLELGDRVERNAEIGIWVHPEFHGRGVWTTASRLLVSYGFDELNLHRLYARTNAENKASQSVWEELGFEQEARMRDHTYQRGSFQDVVFYGPLQSDWSG
jgi:RimJ/RimL family protein N-acetyltransferase